MADVSKCMSDVKCTSWLDERLLQMAHNKFRPIRVYFYDVLGVPGFDIRLKFVVFFQCRYDTYVATYVYVINYL